jgi:hypothetical protein
MLGADLDDFTVVGAFALGAVFATIATLRIVRFVTEFFAGVDRRRHIKRPPDEDDEDQ